MLLYINGDSHTAAAEAVVPHAFAQDDTLLNHLDERPHPYNLAVSWAVRLGRKLRTEPVIEAQSGGSNFRIMRMTRDWLQRTADHANRMVILQWSTWERQEWRYRDQWIQITASGIDSVPKKFRDRYREFVISVDWPRVTQFWHDEIWRLHQELLAQSIPHVFFNGNNDFARIQDRRDWSGHYIGPYDSNLTFDRVIRTRGHRPVRPESWHFGPEGHRFWSEFLLQYMLDNNIVSRDAISLD
jgi:hypothetical protein